MADVATMEVNESPHGSRGCRRKQRYWCVVCWRLTCWCKGGADEIDEILAHSFWNRGPIRDAGLCDDCWYFLGGDGLFAEINDPELTWEEFAL